jgi:DNA polymerase alpha subunit A
VDAPPTEIANHLRSIRMLSPPLSSLAISMKVVLNPKTHSNEIVALSGVFHKAVNSDAASSEAPSNFQRFTAIRKPDFPTLNGVLQWPGDWIATTKRKQSAGEPLFVCTNERHLLQVFVSRLAILDPDILMGHNFVGFDLDVLLHRMVHYKTPMWSRLGRLRRSKFPKLQAGAGGMGDR